MAETSVINQIAFHPTAETAAPSASVKGSNSDFSAWGTTGAIIMGSRQRGDDVDLDAENVTVSMERQLVLVDPARSLQVEDIILLKNRLANVGFSAYDEGEELFGLLSDYGITANVGEAVASLTPRSMIIEVAGRLFDYYPKVALFRDGGEGGFGDGGVSKEKLIAFPMATATIKSGVKRYWYPAA